MRWTQTESESPDVFMKCCGLADDMVARVLIGVLDLYNLIRENIVAFLARQRLYIDIDQRQHDV